MRGALITLFMTRETVLDQASKSIDSWQRAQRGRGRKTSSSTLFTSHLHESFLNEPKVAYRDKLLPFWLPNCLCTSSSIVYFFYFKTPSFGRMPPSPPRKSRGGHAILTFPPLPQPKLVLDLATAYNAHKGWTRLRHASRFVALARS